MHLPGLETIQRLAQFRNPSIKQIPTRWPASIQKLERCKPKVKVTEVLWKLPPTGWIIGNTNGASRGNPRSNAFGFYVKNSEGNFVYAQAKEIGHTTNTEVMAIVEVIKYRSSKQLDTSSYRQIQN